MLPHADKATSDAFGSMVSTLQKVIGENDRKENDQSRPNTNDEQAGSGLLETIRLFVKLSPDERAALVTLIEALG